MRMYDCILAKKAGRELNREEIEYIVDGFTDGSITDYQMSAFLMAVCLKGMTGEETLALTMAMWGKKRTNTVRGGGGIKQH